MKVRNKLIKKRFKYIDLPAKLSELYNFNFKDWRYSIFSFKSLNHTDIEEKNNKFVF